MGAEPVALEVAACLRESLREFDLVACVGPDRFAALVPEPEEEVPALLARLHGALRDVLARAVQTTPGPSVRMGYAVFPDDGGAVEELESRAAEPRVEGS
jgi:GGDEF domain-containing protein